MLVKEFRWKDVYRFVKQMPRSWQDLWLWRTCDKDDQNVGSLKVKLLNEENAWGRVWGTVYRFREYMLLGVSHV